jgi:hypothetical protein
MTRGPSLDTRPPEGSLEVRERLVEALRLDLVGPGAGHALAEERLPGWVRPSNWYLTGFLVPTGTPPEKRAGRRGFREFWPVISGELPIGLTPNAPICSVAAWAGPIFPSP